MTHSADKADVLAKARTLGGDRIGELMEVITAAVYEAVLRPGDTAIDGGANVGRHSVGMARLVGPGGKVHAFEASPVVLPWLEEWLRREKVVSLVEVHTVAVGQFRGRATFHVAEGGAYGMSGLVAHELPAASNATLRPIEVEVTTIDAVVGAHELVRAIKLDLEGGEFPAMRGGAGTIARTRPVIVFENGRQFSADEYGYTREDFFGFFAGIGYELYDAYGYAFGPPDWRASNYPWQFIAAPPGWIDRLRPGIARCLGEAGIL